jgi:hypothetical protein
MQDPNDLSEKIEKVIVSDVKKPMDGEELTEAEQNSVSGGGTYGQDDSSGV